MIDQKGAGSRVTSCGEMFPAFSKNRRPRIEPPASASNIFEGHLNSDAGAGGMTENRKPGNPSRILTRLLWAGVITLALIGLAAALRRSVVLLRPEGPHSARNPAMQMDAHFAEHRGLTLTHIVPGMLFMMLGPLQFIPGLRSKYPQFHRWSGRIFLLASAFVGVTGLWMAFAKTIGGVDEKAAIVLFGTFFLVALAKALRHARRRQFAQHREWMIRGYAIGLAVATVRPIMGGFFLAAVPRGHVPEPSKFFGAAFWIGFTLQMIAAEIWINYMRAGRTALVTVMSRAPAAANVRNSDVPGMKR